jgi:hypothetical protein
VEPQERAGDGPSEGRVASAYAKLVRRAEQPRTAVGAAVEALLEMFLVLHACGGRCSQV